MAHETNHIGIPVDAAFEILSPEIQVFPITEIAHALACKSIVLSVIRSDHIDAEADAYPRRLGCAAGDSVNEGKFPLRTVFSLMTFRSTVRVNIVALEQ